MPYPMKKREKQMKEYIYLNDDNEPIYSSSDKPLKFEEQTPCIVLNFESEWERKTILDSIFGKERENGLTTIN